MSMLEGKSDTSDTFPTGASSGTGVDGLVA